MRDTKYFEYILAGLNSVFVSIYTLYLSFPLIPHVLLYIIHVIYLLHLSIYMNRFALVLTSSSLNIFMNISREARFKYGLSKVLKILLYLNLYQLILLFIAMITLSRSIGVLYATAVLLFVMNTLYTAVFYLTSTLFRNNYLVIVSITLLNVTGLLLNNRIIVPILMFPEVDIESITITTLVSLVVIVFTTIRWSREWSLKLRL